MIPINAELLDLTNSIKVLSDELALVKEELIKINVREDRLNPE